MNLATVIDIIFPISVIISFLGLIPCAIPLFMGIITANDMLTEFIHLFNKKISLKSFVEDFNDKENLLIVFPLCLLLMFALVIPYRNNQIKNAPKIDGYYSKITSTIGNFTVHTGDRDETFTEAMISFGSGREEKAILKGWHKKGETVLVARVGGGDFKNFTADDGSIWGTKIIPRPIPHL